MSFFNQTIDEITKRNAAKGKQMACRQIYDQFSKPVYNLAYHMLQNREDALDVMQNSFVALYSKISQWSGEVKFGFWVRKITINHCLNLIRKNKIHLEEIEDKHIGTHADLDYDHQYDLAIYLKKLPPVSRNILWLYEVEGLTHVEIAELFKMSESFSKSQLSRTRKILSEWINTQEMNNDKKQSN